jgi:hypothetical protein
LRRIDRKLLDPAADEILCFVCLRNENLRLPGFLDYYRELGVHRFVVVDNGSLDGSTDTLLAEPDVHVFHTDQRYSLNGYGVGWLNSVLAEHGVGRWTVTVDVDEWLVYPWCEEVALPALIGDLDRRGEQALLTFLLDMYADRPIRDATYDRGASCLEACPWFDGGSYEWDRNDPVYGRVPLRGGPRARLFWAGSDKERPSPFLPKIPLVKWRADLAYSASTHVLPGARLAALSGALLHFKLMADFVPRVAEEARRGEHWDRAGQYVQYAEGVRARPDVNPMYDGSVRYSHSRQLVALGLATMPAGYPPRGGSSASTA